MLGMSDVCMAVVVLILRQCCWLLCSGRCPSPLKAASCTMMHNDMHNDQTMPYIRSSMTVFRSESTSSRYAIVSCPNAWIACLRDVHDACRPKHRAMQFAAARRLTAPSPPPKHPETSRQAAKTCRAQGHASGCYAAAAGQSLCGQGFRRAPRHMHEPHHVHAQSAAQGRCSPDPPA